RVARRVLAACAGFLLLLAIPALGPAKPPGVTSLRQKSTDLAARSRAALLDLYALGSKLDQTRGELARLDAEAADLARRQASAAGRYQAAEQTMTVAERRLGQQLRLLYEQDEPDPIAVVLGATSLEQAVEELDNLRRITQSTDSVLAAARVSRRQLQ